MLDGGFRPISLLDLYQIKIYVFTLWVEREGLPAGPFPFSYIIIGKKQGRNRAWLLKPIQNRESGSRD
jgi:hypothetical protein